VIGLVSIVHGISINLGKIGNPLPSGTFDFRLIQVSFMFWVPFVFGLVVVYWWLDSRWP
jgi:hypothetical protein